MKGKYLVKVTAGRRIRLPKELFDMLEIDDYVLIWVEGNHAVITKAEINPPEDVKINKKFN